MTGEATALLRGEKQKLRLRGRRTINTHPERAVLLAGGTAP